MGLPRFVPRARQGLSIDSPPEVPIDISLDGLPAEPLTPSPAMRKSWPSTCRYHLGRRAAAAVKRDGEVEGDGWLLLCVACGDAVRRGSLVILDRTCRYRGRVPPA